jgi:hypothetical protein
MIEGCNAEMRSHAQSPLGTWHIGMQSVDHFPIIYEDILCMLPCLRFQTCVGSRSTQSWVPPLASAFVADATAISLFFIRVCLCLCACTYGQFWSSLLWGLLILNGDARLE